MVGLRTPATHPVYVSAKPMTIALVGIGGYGDHYLRALLDPATSERRGVRLVGTVDPFAHRSIRLPELQRGEIPVHDHFDGLYAGGVVPDLVVLASPIAVHAEQTIRALDRGSHVLCEKPLSATLEQAHAMIAARERSGGRTVGIGYQWSFCDAIQRFKHDVMTGRLGRPLRLSTLVLWPRDRRYYARNAWAGRRHDPITGKPVFDSPVNNACAHFLHNMLYVLGDRIDRSARPARVTAELYRANPIENYDTAAIRCVTSEGVELLFYVSHATQAPAGPTLEYTFEHASVRCTGDGPLVAHFKDGRVVDYGIPVNALDLTKLWRTAEAARTGESVECGIEASMAQTQVMCAAQRSSSEIVTFPQELLRTAGENGTTALWVAGLGEALQNSFQRSLLPSESGVDWAHPASEVHVRDCD